MILNINYKYGRGHMTVNLDRFFEGAGIAEVRKLFKLFAEHSSPEEISGVKAYLETCASYSAKAGKTRRTKRCNAALAVLNKINI